MKPTPGTLVALAALSLAAVATLREPSAAAPPPPLQAGTTGGHAGRFQVVTSPRDTSPMMALVDTETGRVWTANVTGGGWEDRGTPPHAAPTP